MILSCCGPNLFASCENIFQPVITDMGICFSLNPTSLNMSLKENKYTDMFSMVFEAENGVTVVDAKNEDSSFELHIFKKRF